MQTSEAGSRLFIVTSQNCYIYEHAGETDGENNSEITDEIFSGWAVRAEPCQEEHTDSLWIHVMTHYGYRGYVRADQLRPVSMEEVRQRQHAPEVFLIGQAAADVLAMTRVQGQIMETLLRGSIVELLEDEGSIRAEQGREGWARIRTASGNEGYVHAHFLRPRKDDDTSLLEYSPDVFNANAEALIEKEDEAELRRALTDAARLYLGVQYRWAGKSSLGIDCSGLTFMSYMMNGMLIYRDAWIRREHPIREITRDQLKEGDLIFFEGHVAMYLGGGRYIHSTGFPADACVTVNSLDPTDPLFRPDLPDKIIWYGSAFEGERVTKTEADEKAVLERRAKEAENALCRHGQN